MGIQDYRVQSISLISDGVLLEGNAYLLHPTVILEDSSDRKFLIVSSPYRNFVLTTFFLFSQTHILKVKLKVNYLKATVGQNVSTPPPT